MFQRGFLNNLKPTRPAPSVESNAIQKEKASTPSAHLSKDGFTTVDEVEVTMGEILALHLGSHSVEKISEMVKTGAINIGHQPKDLSKGYNGDGIGRTPVGHGRNSINLESDIPWDLSRYEDRTYNHTNEEMTEAWRSMGYPKPNMRVCKNSEGSVLCIWAYSEVMSSIPTTITWRRPPESAPAPYEIVKIPGKGQGMRARRAIGRGETILFEMPLFMAPILLAPGIAPEQDREPGLLEDEQLLMNSLKQFGPADKARILALTGFKQRPQNILGVNTLTCDFPQCKLKIYSGLCPEIARINHSCTPNANYKFKPKELVVEVRALQPIAAGAEITVTYRDLSSPQVTRRSDLKRLYSFLCCCAACEASPTDVLASDLRRIRIGSICYDAPAAFREWLASKDEPVTPLLIRLLDLLKQIDKEKLDGRRGVPIRWLAHAYAANGDRRLFEKWAQEAVEYVPLLTTDEGFCDAGMWVRWLDDPVAHPLWNVRNRKA